MVDEATGEMIERRLDHQSGEAQEFYRHLQGAVRVGIEATPGATSMRLLQGWGFWGLPMQKLKS
jgi:hypothetical protein